MKVLPDRKIQQCFVEIPLGNIPLGRLKIRFEVNLDIVDLNLGN